MSTKIVDSQDGIRYTVSTDRIMGECLCLSLGDDEMYGEVFEYDGKYDYMNDMELEESCYLEDVYRIISQEPLIIEEVPDMIYIVRSRDTTKIYCTRSKEDAERKRNAQELDEEMSGGRPSVWVDEAELHGKQ